MSLSRIHGVQSVTIANGATASTPVSAGAFALFQLLMPAAFTGTTVTFTTSDTAGGTYQALYDNTGAAVSLTVAASRNLDLPTALASSGFFRIVSGSAEGAARTLQVVCKG